MIRKKCSTCLVVFLLISLNMMHCNPEGEDNAVLKKTNELEIHGENSSGFQFDHDSTLMITHLYTDSSFTGEPSGRLTQKWLEEDEQGNLVASDSTEKLFINAVDSNTYYARSFIDMNKNSEPDLAEPYDEWREEDSNNLKAIHVNHESSLVLRFKFDKLMQEF